MGINDYNVSWNGDVETLVHHQVIARETPSLYKLVHIVDGVFSSSGDPGIDGIHAVEQVRNIRSIEFCEFLHEIGSNRLNSVFTRKPGPGNIPAELGFLALLSILPPCCE